MASSANSMYVKLQELNNQANREEMAFNKQEAATARAWQEQMSNTAHVREVADLKEAGLNPVLSSGGSGAQSYTTSSASANLDSASGAVASAYGSVTSAAAQRYSADRAYAASLASAQAVRDAAKLNYDSVVYQTDNSKTGTWAGLAGKIADKVAKSLGPSAGKAVLVGASKLGVSIERLNGDLGFYSKNKIGSDVSSKTAWNNLTKVGQFKVKRILVNAGFQPTQLACQAVAYALFTGKPVNWKKYLFKA